MVLEIYDFWLVLHVVVASFIIKGSIYKELFEKFSSKLVQRKYLADYFVENSVLIQANSCPAFYMKGLQYIIRYSDIQRENHEQRGGSGLVLTEPGAQITWPPSTWNSTNILSQTTNDLA